MGDAVYRAQLLDSCCSSVGNHSASFLDPLENIAITTSMCYSVPANIARSFIYQSPSMSRILPDQEISPVGRQSRTVASAVEPAAWFFLVQPRHENVKSMQRTLMAPATSPTPTGLLQACPSRSHGTRQTPGQGKVRISRNTQKLTAS